MSNLNMITPLTVQGIINRFCYTIGMLPTSYKQSLTYEEQLLAIGHYLENTVYPAINNNAQALAELQGLFAALQDYVNNYFDNLDLTEEINAKLDTLVADGTLENLVGAYIQPRINEQNEVIQQFENETNAEINRFKNTVNGEITSLSNYLDDKIETTIGDISTGTPLVASSTAGMTDTTRIYVNTTDGHWYYYNGSAWTDGGTYQATEIPDGSIGRVKLSFMLTDYTQMFNKDILTVNKYVNPNNGNLATPNDGKYHVSSDYIEVTPLTIFALTPNDDYWARAFYDENKSFLSNPYNNTNRYSPFVVPQGARYFRFSIMADTQAEMENTVLPAFTMTRGTGIADTFSPYYKDIEFINYLYNSNKFVKKTLDNSVNLYNGKILRNAYLTTDGGVHRPTDGRSYYTTDFISCAYGHSLEFNTNVIYVCEYDTNHIFLETARNVNAASYTAANADCAYIRVTIVNTPTNPNWRENDLMIALDELPDHYVPYINLDIPYKTITYNMLNDDIRDIITTTNMSDKAINIIGDSIVYGYNGSSPNTRVNYPIPAIIETELRFGTARNYGINGSSYGGTTSPIYNRYSEMDNSADYILSFAGVNDFGGDVPLGSSTDKTSSTFYGCLDITIKGLINKYPTGKIAFITPLKCLSGNTPNAQNLILEDYVNAIITKCKEYAIPVLDFFNYSGCVPEITAFKTNNLPDGLHPNQNYYYTLAHKIADFIKSL